jgi:hypothetical protein
MHPKRRGSSRGNKEAIRRLFKVTRVSTGNMPTLPAIFPDGIAPVGRTNDDERELLNIRWGMPGPQFGGGAITNIRTKSAHWRRWLKRESNWAAPRKAKHCGLVRSE